MKNVDEFPIFIWSQQIMRKQTHCKDLSALTPFVNTRKPLLYGGLTACKS